MGKCYAGQQEHLNTQQEPLNSLTAQSKASGLLTPISTGKALLLMHSFSLQVFLANSENNKKLSSIIFTSPITARFLRILPKTWHGQPCMRLEICGHSMFLLGFCFFLFFALFSLFVSFLSFFSLFYFSSFTSLILSFFHNQGFQYDFLQLAMFKKMPFTDYPRHAT